MTMSVVEGIMGANLQNKEPSTIADPSIQEIASAFARQYYQVLCEDAKSAHKFYGHESTLIMNEKDQVSGQEKIGRLLEDLFQDAKSNRIKVYTIKGAMLDSNKQIMILVFGEIAGRRFTQTFLLASQGLKKYYIQHDAFMFCDLVFPQGKDDSKSGTPTSATSPAPAAQLSPAPVTVEKTVPAPAPVLNGHKRVESAREETPILQATPEKPKNLPAEQPAHEDRPPKRHTPRKDDHTPKKREETLKATENAEPAKIAAPAGPKTWANVLGGGSNAKTSVTIVPVAQTNGPRQPMQPKNTPAKQTPPAPKSQEKSESPAGRKEANDRTIFVGGIQRNSVPENAAAVESDLKEAFSKFGDVESVSVPPKALGRPGETGGNAFAFVTMKSQAEVDKVMTAANKGERDMHRLSIKVASFGHDGELNVSEQKNYDNRDRFNNNRGGRGRGRGGPGWTRGGFRSQPAAAPQQN